MVDSLNGETSEREREMLLKKVTFFFSFCPCFLKCDSRKEKEKEGRRKLKGRNIEYNLLFLILSSKNCMNENDLFQSNISHGSLSRF